MRKLEFPELQTKSLPHLWGICTLQTLTAKRLVPSRYRMNSSAMHCENERNLLATNHLTAVEGAEKRENQIRLPCPSSSTRFPPSARSMPGVYPEFTRRGGWRVAGGENSALATFHVKHRRGPRSHRFPPAVGHERLGQTEQPLAIDVRDRKETAKLPEREQADFANQLAGVITIGDDIVSAQSKSAEQTDLHASGRN